MGTAFHTSKLKCFRHRLEEMGEDRVKDLCMLSGREANDLDAFRTVNFTESFQNIEGVSHANGDILALRNLLKVQHKHRFSKVI